MTAPANESLCATVRSEIDAWLKKFPAEQKRSAILYALRLVQEEKGWVSEAAMDAVAAYLEQPKISVYEVATFYSMYDLKPRGKYKIGVCTNISCMLCESKKIVDHLKNKLKVGFNETTEDGKFILKELECLAACAGAPAMLIDDKHYHEHLTPEKVDKILENLE